MSEEIIGAVGRRKEAVARVFLRPGNGETVVNGKELSAYLGRDTLVMQVRQPLEATKSMEKFDIRATVRGGGVTGQAGAVSLGLARALKLDHPDYEAVLREQGLLTRDPRMIERKKYGLRKARRATQFSKR